MFYDFRLVEHTYTQRVEWEDGPGSMQNVVSDENSVANRYWYHQKGNFGHKLERKNFKLSQDSPDGKTTYTHEIQRRPEESKGKWEFVRHL